MKVVKPQKLGVLHRVFESDRRSYLVVTVLLLFPFEEPKNLLTEVALWKLVGEELGEDGVLDEGLSKVQGEVLVNGRCFAIGEPRVASYVRFQLGAIDKKLAVVGDRQWKRGVPTEPQPFQEMPIDFAHAFGGEGYAPNPLGRGFAPVRTDAGEVHPLPNVEDPKKLLVSPRDRPLPASFGPIDLTWPQRYAKVGTYDMEWLKTRFPGIAKDMDPTFFNTAPEDQRVAGYIQPGEPFEIENMHPEQNRLRSQLPPFVARVFLTQRGADGADVFREVSTRIDTVRLFPGQKRGVVIFRGMIAVAEDDAADVVHLVAACEDPAAPRGVDHYQAVLAKRLDKDKSQFAGLLDAELMPPPGGGLLPRAEKTDVERMVASEGLMAKNLRRGRDREHLEARAFVESMGGDPAMLEPPSDGPELPNFDDPDAVMEFVAKEEAKIEVERAAIEAEKKVMEDGARATAASLGMDYDKLEAEAKRDGAGPPKFSARTELTMMRELAEAARVGGAPMPDMEEQLADPAFEATLVRQEQQLRDAYVKFAHVQPAAASLEGDASDRARVIVTAAVDGSESLAGRDFTGANFAGMALAGIDFSDAFLEAVDFSGADLSGADLSRAVLAHANLGGAKLAAAKLASANLGSSRLALADLTGADLTNAVLDKADLSKAMLRSAKLAGSSFLEAKFGGADFTEASAPGFTAIRCDVARAIFARADLSEARLIEIELTGADFSGANLRAAQLVGCRGEGVDFRGARLESAVFVHGSAFPGAHFDAANLDSANLRTTALPGASFVSATMRGADLSECDLRGANLYHASAERALMIRTDLGGASLVGVNLMEGLLSKARLQGTDLTGSNLFRADLSLVRVDGATKLTDANMTQARVDPRYVPPPPPRSEDGQG